MKKVLITGGILLLMGIIAYLYSRKHNAIFGSIVSKDKYSSPPSSSDASIVNQQIMLISPVKDDNSDIWVMIPNPSVFNERIGENIKLWHPGYPSVIASIKEVWQSKEGYGSIRLDTPFVSNSSKDKDDRKGYIIYTLT
ncbi:MAG: hypothetical protein PHT77_09830 [Bacteroidales bacterium]|nr:hypothetical protein [Bacteroidales bacterium]